MLKKISRMYLRIVEIICVALLLVILGCMCIQITCRLLTVGQNFTEELSRICFCLLVFVGSPLVLTEGAHIAVDMVVNILPAKVRNAVEVLDSILIAIFSAFCIRSLVTFTSSNKGVAAVSMTWIQMNWIYYAMMVSFGFMFIVSVIQAVNAARGKAFTMDIHEAEKAKQKEEEGEVDLGI